MTAADIWLFLQQGFMSGLVSGSIYALIAVAILLIFQTSGVANFAQGEIYMVGGYIVLYLVVFRAWPGALAVLVAMALAFVLAAAFELVVLRRVQKTQGAPVNMVIATLGLAYTLKGIVRGTGFGEEPRSMPSLVPTDTVMIGDAALTTLDLTIVAAAVVAMALFFWMFNRTRLGRSLRAVGMNPKAAQLMGVHLGRTRMLVWGLSAALSTFAAALIGPKVLMTADMGHIAMLGFAAAIVGGFSSLPGAIIGGFVIGIVENMMGLFVSTNAIVVSPFLVIMIVLVLRPQGLLGGRVSVKKV